MFFDATATQDGWWSRPSRRCSSCCVPTEESARPEEAVAAAGRAALGHDLQLPGVRHLGQREVHPVQLRRHPDPGGLQRDAWRRCRASSSGKQNPTSGSHERPPGAPHGRRRHPGLGRVRASTATRPPGAPLAAFNGIDDPLRRADRAACCCCPPPRSSARRWPVPDEHHQHLPGRRSTASRCRPTSRRCWCQRTWTTASSCPDTVRAALPRPRPDRAGQGRRQGRLADQGQRPGRRRRPARAADLRRGHRAGGRVRHRRHVHGDPRLRPGAPASSAAGGPRATSR